MLGTITLTGKRTSFDLCICCSGGIELNVFFGVPLYHSFDEACIPMVSYPNQINYKLFSELPVWWSGVVLVVVGVPVRQQQRGPGVLQG